MKRRTGFSMIEVMIAMGMGSVLMLLAVDMVHRAMTVRQTSVRQDLLEKTAARLSRQFRQDVHLAQAARIAEGRLTLDPPKDSGQARVTYSRADETVIRLRTSPSGQERREVYHFDSCPRIMFTRPEGSPLVELQVLRNGRTEDMPPRVVLQAQALIGRSSLVGLGTGGAG